MKKVILATDGSELAEDAAKFLAHLPHSEQVELIVLTVIPSPHVNPAYPLSDWEFKVVEGEKALANETFHKVEKIFEGANVQLGHVVREGDPGDCIVHFATEQRADLIVMGARGKSAIRRMLLGSTSDFVATHAHCSVLVVRPRSGGDSGSPLRIVIGFQQTGPSQAAVEEFAETHWGQQSEVDVVCVVSSMLDSDDLRGEAQASAQTAVDRLRNSSPRSTARIVESDHVGEGLVVFAEDHQCDLVVVGETHRSFLGRLLIGSVTSFVLRHSPCSVWVTRNRIPEKSPAPTRHG
ncbi:Putative universal stress protein [Rubripirellula lacrimiformis]|uniref:Universal stress protein n=1 Tax=Rubripirellula lacrimiformis TaxID=1930273 RepID=A0A517N4R5_9BACT|nr:universal stress protein [Rubripirellula lacrimiformis]QDT02127.1 Putative universal stress protein [Rubripirellula lacrimiformis]